MTTTKSKRTPGRPRQFDAEQAIETAQRLFHSRGYDAVSVADLTQAFGINPPSFYAAFGSKLGLYTRVLQRYSQHGAIPIAELLQDNQPVAASLSAVLQEAARRYVADPAAAGCLVLEGEHCQDPDARVAAGEWHAAARAKIHEYIARHYPQEALRVTDYMDTLMLGLSAKAREGDSLPRLLQTARLAGLALERLLPA
ncbi:TetR/AcrR family transcriptional regulator [Klebsiella quasivariicola]|uniref:TetR/AcrR family transcriptional regulator n=1 Tax=Klebsiella quasivariicola TaxID=2026240 RepID=UPI001CCD4524|nr:TetR/AcrR family transcriptional regulator [Klebsiella quasivariicola]MBZ9582374.1 TetR/AcrR family transcriptional regulator [Klebsiella quasivariicola]